MPRCPWVTRVPHVTPTEAGWLRYSVRCSAATAAASDSSLTGHRVIRVGKGTGFGFSVSGHELVDTPTSFTAVYACASPYSHTSPDTQGKPFLIRL